MNRILVIAGTLAAGTLLGGWGWDRQAPYCLYDREFTSCTYPSLSVLLGVGKRCRGLLRREPALRSPTAHPPRRRQQPSASRY